MTSFHVETCCHQASSRRLSTVPDL